MTCVLQNILVGLFCFNITNWTALEFIPKWAEAA